MVNPFAAGARAWGGYQHAQILWWPKMQRYVLVAEHFEHPHLAMASVSATGAKDNFAILPFVGLSPHLALTTDGFALCYLQHGAIYLTSTPDGKQWTASRPILPDLTNLSEISVTGDGRGTLYLLARSSTSATNASRTAQNVIYCAVSHDAGASWSKPQLKASFANCLTNGYKSPIMSLTLDRAGQARYALGITTTAGQGGEQYRTRLVIGGL